MFRLVTICALIFLLVNSLNASGGGFGGFSIFGLKLNISSINDALAQHNMPTFSDKAFATGGMGFALINRIFIGGEGFGGSSSVENDSIKLSFSSGAGFFNIGYVLPLGKIINLYPILGIGGIGHSITFRPRLGDMSFVELISNPKRTSIITTGSFAFNFSLGVHIVDLFGSPSFVSLFLRAGYILELSKPDWQFEDGAQVLSGPDKNLSAPFATFSILFGGRSKE